MRPWYLAVTLVVLGLCARVVVGGQGALERGVEAEAAGSSQVALLEYRQSMAWYLPVAPWRQSAGKALWAAYERESEGARWESAVQVLNMLRAGLKSSRALLGGEETLVATCDQHLAQALARWEAEAASREGRAVAPLVEREAVFAASLSTDPLPSRALGLWVAGGFYLWLFGAAMLAVPMGTKPNASKIRRRRTALAASIVGLALFLGGLAVI